MTELKKLRLKYWTVETVCHILSVTRATYYRIESNENHELYDCYLDILKKSIKINHNEKDIKKIQKIILVEVEKKVKNLLEDIHDLKKEFGAV